MSLKADSKDLIINEEKKKMCVRRREYEIPAFS